MVLQYPDKYVHEYHQCLYIKWSPVENYEWSYSTIYRGDAKAVQSGHSVNICIYSTSALLIEYSMLLSLYLRLESLLLS